MTGDQRGDREDREDKEDNILAGHKEILVMGTLRLLDAGLTYIDADLTNIDADLCTDQGWIRRRFVIFRRGFGINRCSFVKFLGENLCKIDAQK